MVVKQFARAGQMKIRVFVFCVVATGINFASIDFAKAAGTITYIGVVRDQTDFKKMNIGKAGYWFPQFRAKSAVAGRPTGENARDALPRWIAPLNHVTSIFNPAYKTRTFSQDGPARSAGGNSTWDAFTLPNGETGRSGAIVDPHARKNTNNTINRIQIRDRVPGTFFFHVVTDNTNQEHDPNIRLHVRGHTGGADIEAKTTPKTSDLKFNGVADVYTFRCDGFEEGDFLKLRLSGDSTGGGPSFGGVLFDTTFELPREQK
jgi:hypothetical protein